MSQMTIEVNKNKAEFDGMVKLALMNLRKEDFSRAKLLRIKANEEKYIQKFEKKWSCKLNRAVLQAIEILLNDPTLPE